VSCRELLFLMWNIFFMHSYIKIHKYNFRTLEKPFFVIPIRLLPLDTLHATRSRQREYVRERSVKNNFIYFHSFLYVAHEIIFACKKNFTTQCWELISYTCEWSGKNEWQYGKYSQIEFFNKF
jgi:hypothetical protein